MQASETFRCLGVSGRWEGEGAREGAREEASETHHLSFYTKRRFRWLGVSGHWKGGSEGGSKGGSKRDLEVARRAVLGERERGGEQGGKRDLRSEWLLHDCTGAAQSPMAKRRELESSISILQEESSQLRLPLDPSRCL